VNTIYRDVLISETKIFSHYIDAYAHIKSPYKRFLSRVLYFFVIGPGLTPIYKYKRVYFKQSDKSFYETLGV